MTRVTSTGDVYVDDVRAGRVRRTGDTWTFVAVGSARSAQQYASREQAVKALVATWRRMREQVASW